MSARVIPGLSGKARRLHAVEVALDPARQRHLAIVCAEPVGGDARGSILTDQEWDGLFGGRYPLDPRGKPEEAVPREVHQFRWLVRYGSLTKAKLVEAIEAYLARL